MGCKNLAIGYRHEAGVEFHYEYQCTLCVVLYLGRDGETRVRVWERITSEISNILLSSYLGRDSDIMFWRRHSRLFSLAGRKDDGGNYGTG